MKNLLLTVSFFSILIGCTKNNTPNPPEALSPAQVRINYIDQSGNNLFTDGSNGYIQKNVTTYTMVNGIKSLDSTIEMNNSNNTVLYAGAAAPMWKNLYNVETKDSSFSAIFTLRLEKLNKFSFFYDTTLISLKPGVTDTLRTYIITQAVDSVWYNSQLMFPQSKLPNKFPNILTIKKNN